MLNAYLKEGYDIICKVDISPKIKEKIIYLENEILFVENIIQTINLYKNRQKVEEYHNNL